MEDLKIGLFIRDRRIELGMTQQQLADKLGITDKAVSKWERSVSYPDITILRELSAALEVSVTELLAGEREKAPSPVPQEVEDVVLDTVSYAETARKRNSGWRFWTFVVLSIGCAIGALVCFIFFCILGFERNWTTIAIQSIALGWAVCYPLLRVERYPVRRSLTILTLAIFPFLAGIDPELVFQLPLFILELISIADLWAIYLVCVKFRQEKLLATSLVLALGGVLSVAIAFLGTGDESDLISGIALFAAGMGCFLGNRWRRFWSRRKRCA